MRFLHISDLAARYSCFISFLLNTLKVFLTPHCAFVKVDNMTADEGDAVIIQWSFYNKLLDPGKI